MAEILLVEDEESVNRGIEFTLTKEGYQVQTAGTIREAEERLKSISPQMVICDVNLPDGSGLDLIREIRKSSLVHIICLTALDTEIDQVMGYEAGADDYITKPFSLSVLVLKVNAFFKRMQKDTSMLIESGGMLFNLSEMTANKDGVEISFTKNEWKMLKMFLEHPRQILSKNQILERLFDAEGEFVDENTVEYTLEGISQVQLKEDIGLTFPVALRTFLRQDPDIIMLGEIRDEETAEMAVRSSLTGHLLLSTLHTNSAWGCITRLTDMGIHPYLLSETLAVCVAQRLVRLLCPHCKRPVQPPEGFLDKTAASGTVSTFGAAGCGRCYFTGYSGRKAIYEVIAMDSGLKDAVRKNSPDTDRMLKERGVKTLKDSALALYFSGETSIEEIYPIISSATADSHLTTES